MPRSTDQTGQPPDPPGDDGPPPTEIEITVAGHTVVVKAAAPMADVASQALGLFEQTAEYARRSPVGFDVVGGQVELAPAAAPGPLEPWEED